jgi:hypothetical protein
MAVWRSYPFQPESHYMKPWHYLILLSCVALVIIITSSIQPTADEPECTISPNQTIAKWKDMYWFPCQYSWNGNCIWPIRRKHTTYKVTLLEGSPLRDDRGNVVPVAKGKVKDWTVIDQEHWNAIAENPREKNRYLDFEPIAENEFVILIETRYLLFNDVESTVRICTTK